MLSASGVSVSLCKPEINCKHVMLPFADPNKEVVGFYVSVEIQARMNVLNSLDHLIGQH
jgi:hypothetical protein